MRWLIEAEDGEIRECDKVTHEHLTHLRMVLFGDVFMRVAISAVGDTTTLLHPRHTMVVTNRHEVPPPVGNCGVLIQGRPCTRVDPHGEDDLHTRGL